MKNEQLSTLLFKLALIPLIATFVFYGLGYINLSGILFAVMVVIALTATALGSPGAGGMLIIIFFGLGIGIYNKGGKELNQTIGLYISLMPFGSAFLWFILSYYFKNGSSKNEA